MPKTKHYYLVEEIDIDGDKNPDGMLVSQYKIDKYGDRIFLKNKYISFADFYKRAKNMQHKKGKKGKKGGKVLIRRQLPIRPIKRTMPTKKTSNNLIVLTPEQFNALMNKHNHNKYEEPPANVIVSSRNATLGEKVVDATAFGAGATAGNMAVEGAVDIASQALSSFFE